MSGAVSVGVAAFAIAGAVATEFATFAVIGAIGATVGAIGAVTKVKELQIAGAAIGAVGAIGGIASAAGAFGTGGVFGTGGTIFGGAEAGAAGLAGGGSWADQAFTATQGASSWADTAAAGGLSGIDAEIAQWSTYGAQAPGVAGPSAGTTFIDHLNGAVGNEAFDGFGDHQFTGFGDDVPAATDGTTGTTSTTGTGGKHPSWTTTDSTTGTAGIDPSAAPPAPDVPKTTVSGDVTPTAPEPTLTEQLIQGREANASGFGAGKGPLGPSGGSVASTDSFWKDIWSFAKDNKALVGGMIQGASSFLSGATDPRTPATIQAMNAQAAQNRAAANRAQAEADLINQRLSNMRGPAPRATRITGQPAGVGLINSPTVTGAPV